MTNQVGSFRIWLQNAGWGGSPHVMNAGSILCPVSNKDRLCMRAMEANSGTNCALW